MRLLLSLKVMKRLQFELRSAGNCEIGGLLFGQHVHGEVFRVIEITVQRLGGSCIGFVRDPEQHQAQIKKFFLITGEDYTRFNYLGEWHSHPCFDPTPSSTDLETMQSMVSDPAVGANFLVLIIVRLTGDNLMECTATAFCVGSTPISIPLQEEQNVLALKPRILAAWVRKLFSLKSTDN